jgi:dTMP kinase
VTAKSNKSCLIAIEGIDGAGKTTLANKLSLYFQTLGRDVICQHEPTNGKWGTKLRNSAKEGRLSPELELEYFLNDRKEHVEEVIAPSLRKGAIVILDRYYFSTMAYQGARGFDPEAIRRDNEAFAPVPDYLFILDLDVDKALERIRARGDKANHFEKTAALEKSRDIFMKLADEPFVHVLDANLDELAVFESAVKLIDFLEAEK